MTENAWARTLSAMAVGMSAGGAAEQEAVPAAVAHAASYRIESKHTGRMFEVRVAEPVAGAMGMPEGPRRVLYVLDGDLFFGMATDMTRLMHQLYTELPPLLVVGVGYGEEDLGRHAELRARDFTFSEDPAIAAMAASMQGGREPALPEAERVGGGDAFLAFLTRELQPFIRARYDVAPDGATLFGSSLGGLFATWALLKQAPGIDHYVIVSPALWWNGGEVLAAEPSLRGERSGESRVFIGVGALEEDPRIPRLAEFRLVTNATALGAALAKHPGVRATTHVFADESHTSVPAPALTRGLRAIHGRQRPTP